MLMRLKWIVISCAVLCAAALELIMWKANANPLDRIPRLNDWGIEQAGQRSRPTQARVVQLVSDEGKIWVLGDEARFEFQLLSDQGDSVGLPLRIEMKHNPEGAWQVVDNAAAHYASLPVAAPVTVSPGAGCPVEKTTLDAAIVLASENRRSVNANDCVLLARTLAGRLQNCGIASRQVRVWENPQNLYDSHTLLEIFSREQGKWVLIDPSFVGYYADTDGMPVSAWEARRLSVQAAAQPLREAIQFKPLEGGLPPDTVDFEGYYLSPITMLRNVAIGFGGGWAVLGALSLPYAGEDSVYVPPEIQVGKGVIPPITEYNTSEDQLVWRIGRETSGLVRLTSEGGLVSDGVTLNPDLISPSLVSKKTWSVDVQAPNQPETPAGCNIQRVEGLGGRYLRISTGPAAAQLRIDFSADPYLTCLFRSRVRALVQGVELEYFGFASLFDTRFPVKMGNWQIETTPFFFASTGRVGVIILLPPHGEVDLGEIAFVNSLHDTSEDRPHGFNQESRYRILAMKRNLRNWIFSTP